MQFLSEKLAGNGAERGYLRQPGMTMQLHWNEVGRGEVAHPLTFWLRPLAGGVQ